MYARRVRASVVVWASLALVCAACQGAPIAPAPAASPHPSASPRAVTLPPIDRAAVARLSLHDALPHYRAWATRDDDPVAARAGLRALSFVRDPADEPLFAAALESRDARVRAAAAKGLVELGSGALDRAAPALQAGLAKATVERRYFTYALEAREALAAQAARSPDTRIAELPKADKERRQALLAELRDRHGGEALVRALASVEATPPERKKAQIRSIFREIEDLADPAAVPALVTYLGTSPPPYARTEAALRVAEAGSLASLSSLVWRLEQDPLTLYRADEDPELRRDDTEREAVARALADLAAMHPEARGQLSTAGSKPMRAWLAKHPSADGIRFLGLTRDAAARPMLRDWAFPKAKLPSGRGPIPAAYAQAEPALVALGYMQDARDFDDLVKALDKRPPGKDLSRPDLLTSDDVALTLTLTALGTGAARGLSAWGDPRAASALGRACDEPKAPQPARREACRALLWTSPEAEFERLTLDLPARLASRDEREAGKARVLLDLLASRPLSSARTFVDALREGTRDGLAVATAIGFAGLDTKAIEVLVARLAVPEVRVYAALALLLGGTPETVSRAYAALDEGELRTYETLLGIVPGHTLLDGDDERNLDALARFAENLRAAAALTGGDTETARGSFVFEARKKAHDRGPHTLVRTRLRAKLVSEARTGDRAKALRAVRLLELFGERGALFAVRDEGKAHDEARLAHLHLTARPPYLEPETP